MIRAALVTPNLTLGGAERWLVDLVKHSDPSKLQWVGVAISGFGGADKHLVTELAGHTRLYANRLCCKIEPPREFYWNAIHEITSPDFRETVRRAARGADVVLTWGQPHMGYWFKDLNIPRVICSHTTLVDDKTPITGITHLTAVSRAAMRYFEGRDGYNDLPKAIIYNGADTERCCGGLGQSDLRSDTWNISCYDKVIGYLGRQSREKNPLAAVRAASQQANWHAVYYGSGPMGNDIRQCADNLSRDGRLHMHAPVPNVRDVLSNFDVLMLASNREAFSLALIEAWLAKVPVVATPVGCLPEIEDKYGPMVARVPLNPTDRELKRAVRWALSPGFREVTKRAFVVASQEFTIQAMVNRWTDYLQAVVDSR